MARRAELASDPAQVLKILQEGNAKANDYAIDVMHKVKEVVHQVLVL